MRGVSRAPGRYTTCPFGLADSFTVTSFTRAQALRRAVTIQPTNLHTAPSKEQISLQPIGLWSDMTTDMLCPRALAAGRWKVPPDCTPPYFLLPLPIAPLDDANWSFTARPPSSLSLGWFMANSYYTVVWPLVDSECLQASSPSSSFRIFLECRRIYYKWARPFLWGMGRCWQIAENPHPWWSFRERNTSFGQCRFPVLHVIFLPFREFFTDDSSCIHFPIHQIRSTFSVECLFHARHL